MPRSNFVYFSRSPCSSKQLANCSSEMSAGDPVRVSLRPLENPALRKNASTSP